MHEKWTIQYLLLCCFFVEQVSSQCCLWSQNWVCYQCPNNMHLYRNNCIYNIPKCQSYKDGFDCIKCEPGYSLKMNACIAIQPQYQTSVNHRDPSIPTSGWKSLTTDDILLPNNLQVIQMSIKLATLATGMGVVGVSSTTQNNQKYIRIFYFIDQGFMEHILIARQPPTDSILIYQQIHYKRPNENFIRGYVQDDKQVMHADKFIKQKYPLQAQRLKKAILVDALQNKKDKPSYKRLFYIDDTNGLMDYQVNITDSQNWAKGYQTQQSQIFFNFPLHPYIKDKIDEIRYYSNISEYLTGALIDKFIRINYLNESKVLYRINFYHGIHPNMSDGFSHVLFSILDDGSIKILETSLYQQTHPYISSSEVQQYPPPPLRPRIKINCDYAPRPDFQLNVTFVVNYTLGSDMFSHYDNQTEIIRNIRAASDCNFGFVLGDTYWEEIGVGHNASHDFYRVTFRKFDTDGLIYVVVFLAFDVANLELSALHCYVQPVNTTRVYLTMNNTPHNMANLGENGSRVYREMIENDQYLREYWLPVKYEEVNTTLVLTNRKITYYTFKFTRNRLLNSPNFYLKDQFRLGDNEFQEQYGNMSQLIKKYNRYENLKRTYTIYKDKILLVNEAVYETELWKQADITQRQNSKSFIKNKFLRKQYYKNVTLLQVLASINRIQRFRAKYYVIDNQLMKQITYEYNLDIFNDSGIYNDTTLGFLPDATCDPFPDCDNETIGLENFIPIMNMTTNRTLFLLINYTTQAVILDIDGMGLIYMREVAPPDYIEDFVEGDIFYEFLYSQDVKYTGFKVIVRLGRRIRYVEIVETQNITVGKRLLVTAYNFYADVPIDLVKLTEWTYKMQIKIFQSLTNLTIDSSNIQLLLSQQKLTLLVRDQRKNYTFYRNKTQPIINTMLEDKKTNKSVDNQIIEKLKFLLVDILGLVKLRKTKGIANILNYINLFQFQLKTTFLDMYDQYVVSFERADRIGRKFYPGGPTFKQKRQQLKLKIVNNTHTKPQRLKIIPIRYSSNSTTSIANFTNDLNLLEPTYPDQGAIIFISRLYDGKAYIRAFRKVKEQKSLCVMFLNHEDYGKMVMLADPFNQTIYQIAFQPDLPDSRFKKITNQTLLLIESKVHGFLRDLLSRIASKSKQTSLQTQNFQVLQWKSYDYNDIIQLRLIYESQTNVVEIHALANVSQIDFNSSNFNVNVIGYYCKPNFVNESANEAKKLFQRLLARFRADQFWIQAEKAVKEQYKYFISGGTIVDFQVKDYFQGNYYYKVRYKLQNSLVDVQALYNTIKNTTQVMPITVARDETPLMMPLNCKVPGTKARQCSLCQNFYYLHRDLNCYEKIDNCKLQSGRLCIQCEIGYFKIGNSQCY